MSASKLEIGCSLSGGKLILLLYNNETLQLQNVQETIPKKPFCSCLNAHVCHEVVELHEVCIF